MASAWLGAAGVNATEDEQLEAALRMLGRILQGQRPDPLYTYEVVRNDDPTSTESHQ